MTAPPRETTPVALAGQRSVLGRLPEEWQLLLEAGGERPFRAKQVFRWLHGRGVFDPEQMTDLAKPLRQRLVDWGVAAPGEVVNVHRSRDGSRKLVIAYRDGARVECVLIPMSRDATANLDADAGAAVDDEDEDEDEDGRGGPHRYEGSTAPAEKVTLCVSTQYGCKMGCSFCASGQAGFRRRLDPGEIVFQVLVARRYLSPNERLQNLVFMGMGEPLDQYEETARAIALLTHPDGLDLSLRRITVSTVGVVPGIERLGKDFAGKVGLALSLHAARDDVRGRLVPLNRRYPISRLMRALREYPLPRRRRITIEYTLIDGVNDSLADAQALEQVLRGLRVKVNLIPLNAVAGSPLRPPPASRVEAFRSSLTAAGFSCFLRIRRGDDVNAACGQLALRTGRADDPARSP